MSQKHINLQQSPVKQNDFKSLELEVKNAKNLDSSQENAPEIIERPSPPAQLSPRSISDRLKQPKLNQQKINEAQAKSLSPEPPTLSTTPLISPPPSLNKVAFKVAGRVSFCLRNYYFFENIVLKFLLHI